MKITKVSKRPQDTYYTPVRSLFDEFFNYSPIRWDDMYDSLAADVWEEGNNIFVKMAMPGVKKEDIKISVTGDTLSIQGQSKEEKEEKDENKKFLYKSLSSQSYSQQFNLPAFIDTDKVEATCENGMVTVTLPKAKESQVKEIEVK